MGSRRHARCSTRLMLGWTRIWLAGPGRPQMRSAWPTAPRRRRCSVPTGPIRSRARFPTSGLSDQIAGASVYARALDGRAATVICSRWGRRPTAIERLTAGA